MATPSSGSLRPLGAFSNINGIVAPPSFENSRKIGKQRMTDFLKPRENDILKIVKQVSLKYLNFEHQYVEQVLAVKSLIGTHPNQNRIKELEPLLESLGFSYWSSSIEILKKIKSFREQISSIEEPKETRIVEMQRDLILLAQKRQALATLNKKINYKPSPVTKLLAPVFVLNDFFSLPKMLKEKAELEETIELLEKKLNTGRTEAKEEEGKIGGRVSEIVQQMTMLKEVIQLREQLAADKPPLFACTNIHKIVLDRKTFHSLGTVQKIVSLLEPIVTLFRLNSVFIDCSSSSSSSSSRNSSICSAGTPISNEMSIIQDLQIIAEASKQMHLCLSEFEKKNKQIDLYSRMVYNGRSVSPRSKLFSIVNKYSAYLINPDSRTLLRELAPYFSYGSPFSLLSILRKKCIGTLFGNSIRTPFQIEESDFFAATVIPNPVNRPRTGLYLALGDQSINSESSLYAFDSICEKRYTICTFFNKGIQTWITTAKDENGDVTQIRSYLDIAVQLLNVAKAFQKFRQSENSVRAYLSERTRLLNDVQNIILDFLGNEPTPPKQPSVDSVQLPLKDRFIQSVKDDLPIISAKFNGLVGSLIVAIDKDRKRMVHNKELL